MVLNASRVTRINRQLKKMKIDCQLKICRITPERIGPTARAEPITRPTVPMVAPRCSSGVICKITDWYVGNSTPTEKPSINRPTIIIAKFGAKIMMKVPIMKISNKLMYIRLKLRLFSIHGERGITTDMINIKPVVSQATVLAGKLK